MQDRWRSILHNVHANCQNMTASPKSQVTILEALRGISVDRPAREAIYCQQIEATYNPDTVEQQP